jgi:sigma-B regulation protein RsbU (phosphoserine phosphatase)
MEQQPGHILVVDDNRLNRLQLSRSLEKQGHRVAVAEDGRQALEMVQADSFDLMLLDIVMPEMDGFQVLARLKADERLRDIPVIVISALEDMDSVVRCIELGAEDYLPKPFDAVLLRARIGACLEKKQLRDREVAYLKQINRDLELAWQIQAGLLPDRLPEIPGWQFAATLKPSRQTSGDFYDWIPLPEGQLGLLVADVADKGMGAALYMALSRTLIRTYAPQYHLQPERVLAAANQRLLADANIGVFVTVFYGVLDPATGTLAYCNAGHNAPYLLRAGGDGLVQALSPTGMALGMSRGGRWAQSTVQIARGDTLVLYSDGITEAQDAEKAFFGDERLVEVAQARSSPSGAQSASAEAVQAALLAEFDEFLGDAPQPDDITLMVLVRDR